MMSAFPEFEYRISPADDTLIQVRPCREQQGKASMWSRYMPCDGAHHAERILAMLQTPVDEREWAVLP
ncbi:MAG: hypothetical protein DMF06_03295 [Verrucomicrobia bacterium]|nr:MAG: hypothetical protein DMF06_03295 [Verrucomicrobiota bacterium]